MRLATARCDACGSRFLLAHLQKMVWARLCVACAKKASGTHRRDLDATPETHRSAWSDGVRAAGFGIVPYAIVGLLAACASGGLGAFAGGALWALSLTWFVFALLRAPFSGPGFAIECALQAICLWIAGRGEVPGAAAVDLPLAAGFFLTLIARTLWFGVHLAGLAHDDGEFLDGAGPPLPRV